MITTVDTDEIMHTAATREEESRKMKDTMKHVERMLVETREGMRSRAGMLGRTAATEELRVKRGREESHQKMELSLELKAPTAATTTAKSRKSLRRKAVFMHQEMTRIVQRGYGEDMTPLGIVLKNRKRLVAYPPLSLETMQMIL